MKITAHVSAPNRYGIEPNYYDGVEAAKWLVLMSEPDFPPGEDELQKRVLGEISRVLDIKERLREKGYMWSALGESWQMRLDGTLIFLYNPNRPDHESGWYTLQELEAWVDGSPDNPVLKENQPPKDRQSYKGYFEKELKALFEDPEGNKRLIQIALIKCPFKDLVDQYISLIQEEN